MTIPANSRKNATTAAGQSAPRFRPAPAAAALAGSAIREILKVTERPDILSFAGGLPNPATFPTEAIREAAQRILTDEAHGALQYGPTEGFAPLREAIAARLSAAGQPTAANEVLITTGSQQALDLIGKAFLSPGCTVLAANPSYLGALQAFALHQPQLNDLANLPDHATRRATKSPAAFCYLTPTFGNPDGRTWTIEERKSLLQRLKVANVPLIEDDPYGDLWCDTPPPLACRALAPASTLYLGSFSKILAPGLRMGYVAGPRDTIALLTRIKQAADLHTPNLNQRIVATLLIDGTLDRHLPTLRDRYRQQRDALMAALDRHLRPHSEWEVPAGGMFVWLQLYRCDAGALFEEAIKRQVAFVPGAPFYFNHADRHTLRLSFATTAPEHMDEGMRRLAEAIIACDTIQNDDETRPAQQTIATATRFPVKIADSLKPQQPCRAP